MPYSEEEKTAIMAEARANASAPRFERRDNMFVFTPPRKAEPEPEPRPSRRTFTDAEVARLIQHAADDLRTALTDQREEILEWVEGLLIETTRHYLDRFEDTDDKVISLQGDTSDLKRKFVETDVAELQAEVASFKAGLTSLRQVVEGLAAEVAALRDDVERSAKVVTLRGVS